MIDNNKYKDKIIEGNTFPDSPYRPVNVIPNHYILTEYIPAIKTLKLTKGLETLLTAMAIHEGFFPGSRSYVHHNPGNIGNDSAGDNKTFPTLLDGIKRQVQFINEIISGKEPAFIIGKEKHIAPYLDEEIKRNPQYGLPYNLPGYHFTFTGQLDQYVKIYATGPRVSNNYINSIVSYFKQNGITITPESKIQDLIKLQ